MKHYRAVLRGGQLSADVCVSYCIDIEWNTIGYNTAKLSKRSIYTRSSRISAARTKILREAQAYRSR